MASGVSVISVSSELAYFYIRTTMKRRIRSGNQTGKIYVDGRQWLLSFLGSEGSLMLRLSGAFVPRLRCKHPCRADDQGRG